MVHCKGIEGYLLQIYSSKRCSMFNLSSPEIAPKSHYVFHLLVHLLSTCSKSS